MIKKYILTFIFFVMLVVTVNLKAQMAGSPPMSFYAVTARYGGTDQDYLYSVNNTSDGGFIMGGYSASASAGSADQAGITGKGGWDYWVVKADNTGNIQWQKRYGGTGDDQLYGVVQTSDNGYVLLGRSEAASASTGDQAGIAGKGGIDYWLIKIDSSGNIQWQKRYGGSGDDVVNGANSIVQTADGGFFIGGYSVAASANTGDQTGSNNYGGYDYWVLKTDASGIIQWQKRYGAGYDDFLYSVKQTQDGGYIIAGNSDFEGVGIQAGSSSRGSIDYWLIKVNNTGTIQWQRNYGSMAQDVLYDVIKTNDGGYIIAGHSSYGFLLSGDQSNLNAYGPYDYWIVKISNTGDIQWQNRYGGSSYNYCYAIRQTSDGGFIIGGFSDANSASTGLQAGSPGYGGNDYWILKTDSLGIIQWQKRYGGASDDFLYSISETPDGYLFGGFSAEGSFNTGNQAGTNTQGGFDFWVVRTDKNGNVGIVR
ncbi:hypothetical protein [uncultured Chryseobacterium sp.]|uniref:hypothetical protein n=1 Tax=uncultured Chryseobacterium sp. TaxID=259322 RepID=UPI0025E95EE4|nr:hypothetical protein [uncultured Chryseobacterium sp.]